MRTGLMNIFQKKFYTCMPFFVITLLVVLCYYPTFSGGFVLDDNILIKDNPYVKELHSISSYLAQEDGIVDNSDLGSYHTGYYRPLINLTYWIDYKLWGMNAHGFRTTNLILHLISCFILFRIIALLVKDKHVAFWATILFSLHPANTESVSVIVSRNNILVTLFVLSSFYFYVIGWERKSYASVMLSVICFIGAIFCKEFGVMALPIFFLYHRFMSQKKRNIIVEVAYYSPFILSLIFYFFLREKVIGAILTPFDASQLLSRIYFVPYLIAWNLKLIFFPYGLHQFDLSYPTSLFVWPAIFSIVLVLSIAVVLWMLRKNRVIPFSGLCFLVTLFPVLSIISTASTPNALIALRWLYLPMAFIMIGVAWIIEKGIERKRGLITSFLCIAVFYFGAYSYVLNKNLWHDEDTFLNQEVLHFGNYLHAGGLAERLLCKKEYNEAEKYFRIAIDYNPFQAYNYINYSALLLEIGRPHAALFYLNKAETLTMTHHERGEWLNNKGMSLFILGKKDEAVIFLKNAVISAPRVSQFWANLGAAYGSIGDYRNSTISLTEGLNLSPNSVLLRINLATTYINMKDYERAMLTLEKISSRERYGNKRIAGLLRLAREKSITNRNDD